jgi:hypothetical protein
MQIGKINITHWNLRNPSQLPAMVQTIAEGGALPPVRLLELPDGTVQIQDGHHRCLAYWLSGRILLHHGEFILYPVEKSSRAARGTLAAMAAHLGLDQLCFDSGGDIHIHDASERSSQSSRGPPMD